jgi:D-alanyl-D-alanine carboxypeptidase
MKRKTIIIFCFVFIIIAGTLIYREKANAPDSQTKTTGPKVQEIPGFNKKQYSLDLPSSPWIVVNKKRPLPENFEPQDLVNIGSDEQMRATAGQALSSILGMAKSQGINLSVLSGYRSYARQAGLYNSYVHKDGQAAADTYSARPGHSEHQTGLAVDLGNGVCDLQACFGDTPAGKWLADHAHEHGFIIRYQKGKENLTGYQYEPWHLRYVGTDLATELKNSGQTLEQFFELPAASIY